MDKSQGRVHVLKNKPKKATEKSENMSLWHLGPKELSSSMAMATAVAAWPPRGAGDTSQHWKSGWNFQGKSCKSEHCRSETQNKYDPHPDHWLPENSAQPGYHKGLNRHAAETRRDHS